ncbi:MULTISPECIES: DUF1573 domain-containing protein [Flectobacillus]|uniref:DUF1573 domain-containing protein n=1 Tax=Flectobacillus roseus TaxID=502259 RepID=A0ABT6YAK5_9BACT|nr:MULTISPECIES: DUF1573 domain-containing protein [Flectobacillus]MDI9860611.1 DUF1573 domain-containing protein [Flectobacillus roseus]MDI9872572.1 DUF1573 domain-containing protein [Flectobacillus roseus]
MKKILIVVAAIVTLAACQNKQKSPSEALADSLAGLRPTADSFPVMQIDTPFVDLGTLTEGDSVVHTYKFKNTGNMPLVISNVSTSCGCTTPSYSTQPVAPGEQGFITVKFNSKNKEGKQNKTITAYANTVPSENTFSFKVEVFKRK